jgi:hypothetical protein
VDWILLANTTRVPGRFVHLDLGVIDARLIWRAVNAPTFPLCLAGLTGFQIWGFGVVEILYLGAVAVLWYLEGRFICQRGRLDLPTSQRIKTLKIGSYFLLMAWGIFLSPKAYDEQDRLDLMRRSSVALFVGFEPHDVVGAVEGYEH